MRSAPVLALALLFGPLALPGAPASAAAAVMVPVTTATIVHEPGNGLNELDPWVAAEGPEEVAVVGYPALDPRRLIFDVDPPGARGPEPGGDGYELDFLLPAGHVFEERRYAWGHRGDPDTDVRPTIYASVGSQGCDAAGEITVHDMAPDLSRLWVTFKLWCNSPDAVSYGEIRIDADSRTVGGLVAPALADWPGADVGETSETARWAVQNRSGVPVRLGRPYVTGPDADDFVAGPADCEVVPVGGRCPVPTVFTPRRMGPHEAVLHVPVVGSGDEVTVALRGAGVGAGHTVIEEYGNNENTAWYQLDGPSAHVYSGNSNYGNGVFVAATNPSTGVMVMPPRGETLVVGRRYTGVTQGGGDPDAPRIGAAVMSSSNCEDYIAEFTVHELTYGARGEPASVSLSYDLLCTNWNDQGRDHVERGAFAWRAAVPPPRIEHPPLPEEPSGPSVPEPPAPEEPVTPPATEPPGSAEPVPELVIRSNRARYRPTERARLLMWASGTSDPQQVDLRIRRRGQHHTRLVRANLRQGAVTEWSIRVRRGVVIRAKLASQPWSAARRVVLWVRPGR